MQFIQENLVAADLLRTGNLVQSVLGVDQQYYLECVGPGK